MGKVSLSGSISRMNHLLALVVHVSFAFMNKADVRKLSTLYSGIELICEFLTTILYHNRNLFSIISYCFCLFGEFAKVFERKISRVQVAHLHSAARALPSPNWCFKIDIVLLH